MNRRSAMLVAAGLVLTLAAGGLAVAIGLTGPTSSTASTPTVETRERPEPVVRTVKRTIRVHKKADPPRGNVVTLSDPNPTGGSTPRTSAAGEFADDDGYEGEDEGDEGEDEGDEAEHEDGGEDHEDEGDDD